MINLCQLEHLSCFGCCGHDWKSKKEVLEQIMRNTKRWEEAREKGAVDRFIKESEDHLSRSGGCKSLVFKDGRIVCALHPLQNKGKDLRDKNCNKNYLCETFKRFKTWNRTKQKKFVDFIMGKDMDNYEYSIGMDSGEFLKEFEKITNAKTLR